MQTKFTVIQHPSGEFIKFIYAPTVEKAVKELLKGNVVISTPKWALVEIGKGQFVELAW